MKFQPLKSKGLTLETCSRWGYGVGEVDGQRAQIALYLTPQGQPAGNVFRFADGSVQSTLPETDCQLFGQSLWVGSHRRRLVVVAGEAEAMAIDQATNQQIPVVAVPNGEVALDALKGNLLFVDEFDHVVFSLGDPELSKSAAELLAPGKGQIAYPEQTYVELALAQKVKNIVELIDAAVPYKIPGVVRGAEMRSIVSKPVIASKIRYPFPGLDSALLGFRLHQLGLVLGPPKQGKSTFLAEMAYGLAQQGVKVAVMFLEDSLQDAGLRFIGIAENKKLMVSTEGYSEEELEKLSDRVIKDKFEFWDPQSRIQSLQELYSIIRYLVRGLGCELVIFDPLTYFVACGGRGADERQTLDDIAAECSKLVQELPASIIMSNHVTKPDGLSYEEGAAIKPNASRGGQGPLMFCHWSLGLERNQQGETPNRVGIRILGNRVGSETGVVDSAIYHRDTGRLLPPAPVVAPAQSDNYWESQGVHPPLSLSPEEYHRLLAESIERKNQRQASQEEIPF